MENKKLKYLPYVLLSLFKLCDFPSLLYNVNDYKDQYEIEHISASEYPTFYQIIPRSAFVLFSLLCDMLTAVLLKSKKYFYFSIFLPADISSFENLALLLIKKGCMKGFISALLVHSSVFYAPILESDFLFCLSYLFPSYLKSYRSSHKLSLNFTWFFHLNMFGQYNRFFYDIFYTSMLYLYFMVPANQKEEIILLFKASNYKNYLFYVIDSPYIHIYATLFLVENYIQYLFRVHDTGNPNFCNWCHFIFIVIFLLERGKKYVKYDYF